ncbi:MAG TPA: glycine zipper domain-containing protein [Candidatus Hypogeohydataceae bacterium YC41]
MKDKTVLIVFLLALALVTSGCETMSEHKQAAGTVVGAGAGAAAGAAIGSAFGVPGLGAAIGAGGGGLIGNVIGGEMQKKQEKKEMEELRQKVQELESTKKATSPEASSAAPSTVEKRFVAGHFEFIKKKRWVDATKTERVWVPESTEGDKRIEGHYEERSIPGGNWEEYEEKVWVPDHYE